VHSVRIILSHYGYLAVFAILFLDSLGAPLPTEFSLLASGYLVHLGDFRLWPTIGAAWIGSLAGSGLSYLIGRRFGATVMDRISRLFHLTPEHMARADHWFARHGPKAVFFARFIPVVRNYISYPAGIVRMTPWKFVLFTAAGYGAWEFANVYAAYRLGRAWKVLLARMDTLAWVLAGLAVLTLVLAWLWHRYLAKRNAKTAER